MTTDELLTLSSKLLNARDSALFLREAELFGLGQATKAHHEKFLRYYFREAAELLGYQIIECSARDLEFGR